MTVTTTAPAQDTERLSALVRAHRQAQAGLLNAIKAEHRGAYTAAVQQVERLTAALRAAGAETLADLLTAEVRAGGVLIVALTADDTAGEELAAALTTYQARRCDVDNAG